jgi:hypothetical protein
MKSFFQNVINCFILTILCVILLTSCWWYKAFVYEEQIVDVYYLTACDSEEDMCIQGDMVVIKSTVFAVGYNEDFIIAKQHPHEFAKPIDKSITNYYIIPLKNKVSEFPDSNKIGPLTLEQFTEKRKELNVSDSLKFTIEFEKLK